MEASEDSVSALIGPNLMCSIEVDAEACGISINFVFQTTKVQGFSNII